MLYTFNEYEYSSSTLNRYLELITSQDKVVLWLDGCLLSIKNSNFITSLKAPVFVLENDIKARQLEQLPSFNALIENNNLKIITLNELVAITAQNTPQVAL